MKVGPDAHQDIAVAVARKLGLSDEERKILVHASAYPDSPDDYPAVFDRNDRFPSKHHSTERGREIGHYLRMARHAHLRDETWERDKALGIAMHFIGDALSPYSGSDNKHDEFEREVGQVARRESFDGVTIEKIEPHHVVAHIHSKVVAGPNHKTPVSWFRECYGLCLLAARGVCADKVYPPAKQRIDDAYAERDASLDEIRRDEKANTSDDEAKRQVLQKRYNERMSLLESEEAQLQDALRELQRKREERVARLSPSIRGIPLSCAGWLLYALLVLGMGGVAGGASMFIMQNSASALAWHAFAVILLITLLAAYICYGRSPTGELTDRILNVRYYLRRRGVDRDCEKQSRLPRKRLERVLRVRQREEHEFRNAIEAIYCPYREREQRVNDKCQSEVGSARHDAPNWYLRLAGREDGASRRGVAGVRRR